MAITHVNMRAHEVLT